MSVLVMQRELKHISRDALAGVLGLTGERRTRIDGVRMLDIRRHDERALYGSIPGLADLSFQDIRIFDSRLCRHCLIPRQGYTGPAAVLSPSEELSAITLQHASCMLTRRQ